MTSEVAHKFVKNSLTPAEDIRMALNTPIKLADRTSINLAGNAVNIAEGAKIIVKAGYVLTVKKQGVEVSGGDFYTQATWQEAQRMADALGTLLRNAGGTMDTVAHSESGYEEWTANVSKVMKYFGINTSKDFIVNGMKYGKNAKGHFESLGRKR